MRRTETTVVFTFPLGEGQSLRLFEEADADELSALIADNRDYLARWMPWAAAQTPEGTLAFIRTSRKQWADNDGFQAAIVDGNRIVGVIGYHRLDSEHRSTSIGYWIAERWQGRGIVTRAAGALVCHAFDSWELNRVEIRCGVENARSRAIPERLGFTEEGVLRQAELVGDRYVDHVVYAVLTHDWAARPRSAPVVHSAGSGDRRWLAGRVRERWGSTEIVRREGVVDARELPALICRIADRPVGLATYRIENGECELVTLDAFVDGAGVGSALLGSVIDVARAQGCRRLWLTTTNDNVRALRFYQRHDLRLVAVHRGAVERARVLKPQIPERSDDGIRIRDELELELVLEPRAARRTADR